MHDDWSFCADCGYYDSEKRWCKLFKRTMMCGCMYGKDRTPSNNYERLKTLNLEQMAEFLHDFVMCEDTSLVWIEEWLKEEVDE